LQRTELQDAARALADAVLVALEFGKACPELGTSPSPFVSARPRQTRHFFARQAST
jgi:hypothetical protein